MQFSKKFKDILRIIYNSQTVDADIMYRLLNLSSLNKDFLYIDVNDKDDCVTFIPNKIKDQDKHIYKLNSPRTVNRDHAVYRDYLSTLTKEEVNKINIHNRYKNSDQYKIIKRADAGDGYKNKYQIIHMENLNDGSQFLNLLDITFDDNNIQPCYENMKGSDLKIGRFLRRVLSEKQASSKDIEDIVNAYKSHNLYVKNMTDYIKVVEGEDIKKWYDEDKYAPNQSILNDSCMRYKKCQEYFDIYMEPENGVKMVILTDTNNRLVARALLWTLDDGTKYMDRIYGKDHVIKTFIKWGEDNGYTQFFNNNKGEQKLNVTLKINFEKYIPYLDTFRFMLNAEKADDKQEIFYGKFVNRIDEDMKGDLSHYHYFTSTSGSYSTGRF